MELYLRHDAEFEMLYNCSFYNVSDIPLERRQNVPLGLVVMAVGLIEELLYIPCMFAIWRHLEHSCYKIMFVMGVLDMLCLPIPSVLSGYFSIVGDVYCSSPNLIYVLGSVSFGFWFGETTTEFVLAINRCSEILLPRLNELMFKGRRTWFWTSLPVLYGCYTTMFEHPGIFSGIYFMWFSNPHEGYADQLASNYNVMLLTVHNWLIIGGLTCIYLVLGVYILARSKGGNAQSFSHKMIFLQVALISSVNVIGASVYATMDFIAIPDWLYAVANFGWTQAHGIPPVIYLTMNRTIRNECKLMLVRVFGLEKVVQSKMLTTKVGTHRQQLFLKRGTQGTQNRNANAGITPVDA